MEIVSLTVISRNGATMSQVQLIDMDDVAAPISEVTPGGHAQFNLREGKKGPYPDQNTGNKVTPYIVSNTLASIALAAGSVFTANILTYKGRPRVGSPLMGFNAQFIAGSVIPWNSGSKFYYQEDSDPDLVEYTCTQNPAAILAQITNNSSALEWKLNGNTNGSEKYIGTNDRFDFPVRVVGLETFRFNQDGTITYPKSPGVGYVLTDNGLGIGVATWQPPSGSAPTNELNPAIDYVSADPGGPATGDEYLVLAPGSGAFAGQDNNVATWNGVAWVFTTPALNDYIYITTTLTTYRWNGTAWVISPGVAILQNGNTLGGAGVRIGSNDAHPLWLKTNNTLRVRVDGTTGAINTSYWLGVGFFATTPVAPLEVRSLTSITGGTIALIRNAADTSWMQVTDDGNVYINSPQYTGFALQVNGVNCFQIGTNMITEAYHRIPNNFNYRRVGDDFYIGGIDTNLWYMQDASGVRYTPASSALLDISSTTKGARLPQMTTTQKNAIAGPVEGLEVYDLTLHKKCVYTGAAWETVTSL